MPFTLLQGGTSLQMMNTSGTLTTLSLPSGVVLQSGIPPRFATVGKFTVVVNSPTRPITVDPDGTVRVLCPRPPRTLPVVSAVSGGTLSGTFIVWQSFRVLDADGSLIAESPLGPQSIVSSTLATQALKAEGLDISTDTVSETKLYRSTTGGDTPFPWVTLDGNTATSVQDDLADILMETIAAPTLGSPPDLSLIGSFRGRLWGFSKTEIDSLRYTESGKIYAWPALNTIPVPKVGSDTRGGTGILARRDALAVARQDAIYQVTGDSTANFRLVKIGDNVGVEAPDSIVVYRDVAYFLWKDGVYIWDNNGIRCISDGKVRKWFNSDTYFNRSRFKYAVGRINPLSNKYQLFLSNAGDSTLNRWVEYDIIDRTWWGPHKTDDFTPSWATVLTDSNDLPLPVVGSSAGFLYKDQSTRTDGTSTGIAFDVDGKFHDMNSPDIMKFFGELTLISAIQAAGTLLITPFVGGLNASAGSAISAAMTAGRERLRRLGIGPFCKLNFTHSTAGQDVEIFGYEIPFHEVGRR